MAFGDRFGGEQVAGAGHRVLYPFDTDEGWPGMIQADPALHGAGAAIVRQLGFGRASLARRMADTRLSRATARLGRDPARDRHACDRSERPVTGSASPNATRTGSRGRRAAIARPLCCAASGVGRGWNRSKPSSAPIARCAASTSSPRRCSSSARATGSKTRIWRIPASGRLLIVANHPSGALDALALLDAVGKVRRDVRIVANDVLSALDNLGGCCCRCASSAAGKARTACARWNRHWRARNA